MLFDTDKLDAIARLRADIADRLCDIEDLCQSRGLPLSRLTLVARDPANDDMVVVVTSEPPGELENAFSVALNRAAPVK